MTTIKQRVKFSQRISAPCDLLNKPVSMPFEEWQRQQMERIVLATNSSPIDHSILLRQKEVYDTVLSIGGKFLHVHRAILECRCPGIFLMSTKKRSRRGTIIEIDEKQGVTFKSLEMFLKFMYSGNVQFFGKDLDEIINLVLTAKIYECFLLVEICQQFLYVSLNNCNWFHVVKQAERLGLEEAKIVCKMWAKRYFPNLIPQKAGMDALGMDLFYEVVHYVVLPQQEEVLPSIEHLMKKALVSIKEDFKMLYDQMPYSDVAFWVHEVITCHSSILIAQTGELLNLLKKIKPQALWIELPEKYDFNTSTFQIFLKFLYYNAEDEIDPFVARQLHSFAVDFGIIKLRDVCEKQIKTGINVSNVLKMYQKSKTFGDTKRKNKEIAAELETICLSFIVQNFGKIDFSDFLDIDSLCTILKNFQNSLTPRMFKYVEQREDIKTESNNESCNTFRLTSTEKDVGTPGDPQPKTMEDDPEEVITEKKRDFPEPSILIDDNPEPNPSPQPLIGYTEDSTSANSQSESISLAPIPSLENPNTNRLFHLKYQWIRKPSSTTTSVNAETDADTEIESDVGISGNSGILRSEATDVTDNNTLEESDTTKTVLKTVTDPKPSLPPFPDNRNTRILSRRTGFRLLKMENSVPTLPVCTNDSRSERCTGVGVIVVPRNNRRLTHSTPCILPQRMPTIQDDRESQINHHCTEISDSDGNFTNYSEISGAESELSSDGEIDMGVVSLVGLNGRENRFGILNSGKNFHSTPWDTEGPNLGTDSILGITPVSTLPRAISRINTKSLIEQLNTVLNSIPLPLLLSNDIPAVVPTEPTVIGTDHVAHPVPYTADVITPDITVGQDTSAVVVPDPTVIVPEPTVIVPEPTVIIPEPTFIVPEPTVIVPEPSVIIPEPTVITPDPIFITDPTIITLDPTSINPYNIEPPSTPQPLTTPEPPGTTPNFVKTPLQPISTTQSTETIPQPVSPPMVTAIPLPSSPQTNIDSPLSPRQHQTNLPKESSSPSFRAKRRHYRQTALVPLCPRTPLRVLTENNIHEKFILGKKTKSRLSNFEHHNPPHSPNNSTFSKHSQSSLQN